MVLLVNNVNRDMESNYAKAFEEVASEEFGSEIIFVVSGISYGIQIRLAELLGVSKDRTDLPLLFIMTPKETQPTVKYQYSSGSVEDLDSEKLRNFINDFNNDKLARFYKSQPAPKEITPPSEVRTLVGHTWERDVMDPSKDVLVAYMSTYCRDCAELETVLKELAG